tara:strand:+ start:3727 stop:4365 length:639 start_codon:yes stop_codon:yes gene_type:complete
MIDKKEIFKNTLDKLQFSSTTSLKYKEDLLDYFGENFLDKKVLELGTHFGYSTRFLSFLFKEVHTVDKEDEYVKKASKHCSDRDNIMFWQGDLYNEVVFFEVPPREKGIRVPGLFEEFPSDMDVVFIDASHLYPHVFMDAINSILYFDKPIIVFDDYGTEYPVKRAIDDLVRLKLIKIEKYIGHEKGTKVKNNNEAGDYLNDHEGVICRVLV